MYIRFLLIGFILPMLLLRPVFATDETRLISQEEMTIEIEKQLQLEKYETVVSQITAYRKTTKKKFVFAYQMGLAYHKLNRHDAALKELKRFIRKNEDHIAARRLRAEVYYSINNMGKTIEDLKFLVEKYTGEVDLHMRLAECYSSKWILTSARKHLDIALELGAKKTPTVYRILGQVLKKENRFEESRAAFLKYLETDKDSCYALFNVGHTYEKQFRRSESTIWYEKSLAVNPEFEHSLHHLGVTRLMERRYTEAVQLLKKKLKYEPGHIETRVALGLAYVGLGQKGKANIQYRLVKGKNIFFAAFIYDAVKHMGQRSDEESQAKIEETLKAMSIASMRTEEVSLAPEELQKNSE